MSDQPVYSRRQKGTCLPHAKASRLSVQPEIGRFGGFEVVVVFVLLLMLAGYANILHQSPLNMICVKVYLGVQP